MPNAERQPQLLQDTTWWPQSKDKGLLRPPRLLASADLLRAASTGAGICSKEYLLTIPRTGGSVWEDSESLINPATQISLVNQEHHVERGGSATNKTVALVQ